MDPFQFGSDTGFSYISLSAFFPARSEAVLVTEQVPSYGLKVEARLKQTPTTSYICT